VLGEVSRRPTGQRIRHEVGVGCRYHLFMDVPPTSVDLLTRAVEAGAPALHLVPGAAPRDPVSGDVLGLEGTESLRARRTLLYRMLATEKQQLEVMRKLDFFHFAACRPMFTLLQLVE